MEYFLQFLIINTDMARVCTNVLSACVLLRMKYQSLAAMFFFVVKHLFNIIQYKIKLLNSSHLKKHRFTLLTRHKFCPSNQVYWTLWRPKLSVGKYSAVHLFFIFTFGQNLFI